MGVDNYVVPNDELIQMAKSYNEVSSNEDFLKLVAIEKVILSNHDHETLLNMAATMSVLVNAVFMSKTSREKIFAQGFNTAKKYHARKASKVSHASRYAKKDIIIKEYLSDRANYSNKDSAAELLSTKHSLAFSTVRKYLKNI